MAQTPVTGASTDREHRLVSGEARGVGATLARAGLAIAEPVYATAMAMRNLAYDRGRLATHTLSKPVISVGNITTGGTGKTPMVQWLAERLRDAGHRPAVLMRGYKSTESGSDERLMLDEALNVSSPPIPVIANPNRVAGAAEATKTDAGVDLFILDDGFQHRRVGRDVNIVLISATNPFGYRHVLPRGLLRERLTGLRRADVLILTRADAIGEGERRDIETTIRRHQPRAPLFFARHRIAGFIDAENRPADVLGRKLFVFSAIGDPGNLVASIGLIGKVAGHRSFPDHHAYNESDLSAVMQEAKKAGAEALVITEKDWVKIRPLPRPAGGLPILRTVLRIEFEADGAERLLGMIEVTFRR